MHIPRFSVLLVLAGCATNLPVGAACEATGDGFTRVDPCASTCVMWDVSCADGTLAVPNVCSGLDCTADRGACAVDQGCAQINMTDWECLPLDVCPAGFAP